MGSHVFTFRILATVLAGAIYSSALAQSPIVADFETPATIDTITTGLTWQSGAGTTNFPNVGSASRTGSVTLGVTGINASSKDATVTLSGGNSRFEYGVLNTRVPTGATGITAVRPNFDILAATNNGAPERRIQAIGVGATSTGTVNLSATPFLRHSAARFGTSPTGTWAHVVTMTSLRTATTCTLFAFPDYSTGPWDGSNLTGHALSTTPKAFVTTLTDTSTFKIDPFYALHNSTVTNCNPGPTDVNLSLIQTVGFNIVRRGSDTATALSGQFWVDDVVFSATPWAINSVTTTTPGLQELRVGDTRTFDFVLNAIPTHDVTITANSSNLGLVDFIGSNSVTFTKSNWNTTQTVTVRALSSSGSSNVTFSRTTNDLLYNDTNYPGMALPALRQFDLVVPVKMTRLEIGG